MKFLAGLIVFTMMVFICLVLFEASGVFGLALFLSTSAYMTCGKSNEPTE